MGMKSENVYQRLPLLEDGSSDEKPTVREATLPKPQRPGLRLELQGLRAVAIAAVLLFHTWSTIFKTGYLGVDVFFVISGYLMCHLLSRKMPLGFAEIMDFYFRRVKRIVPIYLFVVGLSVFVAKHYVSRLDFQQLIDEAIPSMFFYSNSPSVHKTQYFDLRSKYFFLLHTWSLSVEMQFYLIVPVLFLIAQKIQKPYLLWTFGILLFGASFLRQCLAEGVAKHMGLDARIWQFMGGFAAHYIFETSPMMQTDKKFQRFSGNCWLLRPLLDLFIIGILSVLLLFEFTSASQFARFCVILFAVLYVSLPDNEYSLLSIDALISLGDASYSIYLIHWPIFTLHRFIDEELYEREGEAPHILGTYLITVAIVFGYFLERFWAKISKYVKTWRSLLPVLLLLYVANGLILLNISNNAVRMDTANWQNADGSVDKVAKDTEELWARRGHPIPLSNKEALDLNMEVVNYGSQNLGCKHRNTPLPTRLNISSTAMGHVCNEKGNGTKNIVIIGNSHAYMTYYGVSRHFRDLAANMSMRAMGSCTPVPLEYQQTTFPVAYRKSCITFINSTVEMLQKWDYPVDIIIALFGFDFLRDPGVLLKLDADPMFVFMQDYYRKLSEIAREVVFIPSMMIRFDRNPMKIVSDKLLNNQPVGEIGEPLEKQLHYFSNIRQRIEFINCPNKKCLLMNWHKLWCKADEGRFCRSVEPIRHISYFLDQHHPSPYGSMFLGEYLRQAYDSFVKKMR